MWKMIIMSLFLVPTCWAEEGLKDDLVNQLVGKLGVSQDQALGGLGSIFSAVKDNTDESNFGMFKDALPNLDKYLDAVPKQDSLLGGVGSMLGGDAKKLAGMAMLQKSFKKLGLDEDTLSKYLPIVVAYVQEKGGDKLKNIFNKSLDIEEEEQAEEAP